MFMADISVTWLKEGKVITELFFFFFFVCMVHGPIYPSPWLMIYELL